MSQLQAILFDKNKYTLNSATKWLQSNKYYPLKYHVTDHYIRARLHEPDYKKYQYRTINLTKNIKAITMYSNTNMPSHYRNTRRRARRNHRRGGSIDPHIINQGINLLANAIIPAILYGGVSYGIYRAAKKN